MPWYSYREVRARFPGTVLVDTPRLDRVVERLASLQRYGLSVRQRRVLGTLYRALIDARLTQIKPDVVLSIGAAHKLMGLESKWPLVHVTDGYFATIVDYYEKYRYFSNDVKRAGFEDYQRFIDQASLSLFASDWARDSALSLYRMDPARVRVVPFGANLDADPGRRERRRGATLKLLFVGYDWQRKGGDLVLAAWKCLRAALPDCELHIVGCQPASAAGLAGVHVYGRIDKAKPDDFARLTHLFDSASLFFMPSRAEAFGMVFCEAAAYGLPVIATATGGVPTVVRDGETGVLLPLAAGPEAYAERILALWNDPARYEAMAAAARARYETTLNWNAWGAALERAIETVVAHPPAPVPA